MEFVIGPIVAFGVAASVSAAGQRRTRLKMFQLQRDLELVNQRIEQLQIDGDGETTKKLVNVMMPVVQAVKQLQETVGVR